MSTKNIVWLLGLSGLILGLLQISALQFSLYWTIWWFDIVMHFLGGFWIALIVLWFYKAFAGENAQSDHGYLIALLGVIVVGIFWEMFEVVADMTFIEANYIFDTILDLIMDVAGAVVATYMVFKKSITHIADKGHD